MTLLRDGTRPVVPSLAPNTIEPCAAQHPIISWRYMPRLDVKRILDAARAAAWRPPPDHRTMCTRRFGTWVHEILAPRRAGSDGPGCN